LPRIHCQRAELVTRRLVAIAIIAVAFSVGQPAQARAQLPGTLHMTPYAGLAWYMAGFELGPWEQYLLQEMTPELERLVPREVPHVSWLQFNDADILPDFALPLIRSRDSVPLSLSFRQSRVGLLLDDSLGRVLRDSRRFEQSLIMPGLTHRVSDNSALTVSAVLASQRYGVADMNLDTADRLLNVSDPYRWFDRGRTEVSHGTGLRFALSSELTAGVRLEAAFQSRINMDEFASMRGIHGASAELDIPPRAQVGLEFHTTSRSWLNLGVSQIFYSDIGAFPSRSLPARFTALLGDRNSPQFAWNDLTVYNMGWRWQAADDVELFFDYRTRTQPKPTASTLASALDPELASNAFLAGVSKSVGSSSRLHFNAAYAPPEFAFGGNLLGVVSDKLDQELEVQAMFSLAF
jgi:hypothetical protein